MLFSVSGVVVLDVIVMKCRWFSGMFVCVYRFIVCVMCCSFGLI